MPDPKTLEIAKNELDALIAIGEKLIVTAGSARSSLAGGQLTDINGMGLPGWVYYSKSVW